MIELDNIELILRFLSFPDPDCYYYLQILQREGRTRQVYSTLITKDRPINIEEVKYLCREFTGRAYISLCPRSLKKFTLELSKAVIERVVNETYVTSTLRLPDSIALKSGTIVSGGTLWMFDIDDPKLKEPTLNKCEECGIVVKLIVPSFQGYHIIVEPFNPTNFDQECLAILKRDANTMIFGCKS